MAISNRFQPPADDPTGAFADVSAVVDQLALLAQYEPSQAAIVSVAAGDFKRLAPRAAGQNVVIPTADGSNFGKTITLFVEATLGACRVRAVSGTINGSTSFTLAAGYVSLIVLTSNGQGRWATQRASGFPIAGAHMTYTGETLDVDLAAGFTWTGPHNFANRVRWSNAFTTTLAATANNLAIGAVNVVRINLTGNQILTGMVPDADDHLVWLSNVDAVDTLTINHADAGSSASNRFNCPGNVAFAMLPKTAVWARKDPTLDRWCIASR